MRGKNLQVGRVKRDQNLLGKMVERLLKGLVNCPSTIEQSRLTHVGIYHI